MKNDDSQVIAINKKDVQFLNMSPNTGYASTSEESSQASEYTPSIINNSHVQAVAFFKEGESIYIAGRMDKNMLFKDHIKEKELLIRAINNRTRERNYFRLYCQLLEKEIPEDYFNEEIDKHEDDYVTSSDQEATKEDLQFALDVSPEIKDVEDASDMIDLFSFSDSSIQKYIK